MAFSCHVCSKEFSNKQNLNRHLKTHTDIAHRCDKCEKSFARKDNLNRHVKTCLGLCKKCQKPLTSQKLTKSSHQCKVSATPSQTGMNESQQSGSASNQPQPSGSAQPSTSNHSDDAQPSTSGTQHTSDGYSSESEAPPLVVDSDSESDTEDYHTCKKCGQRFSSEQVKNVHENTCTRKALCLHCHRSFKTARGLDKHVCKQKKRAAKKKAGSKLFHCKHCPSNFKTMSELYYHHKQKHTDTSGTHNPPWETEEEAPWVEKDGKVDTELKAVYEKYKHLILRKVYSTGMVNSNYNFPIDNYVTVDQLMQFAENVYDQQQTTFKINMSFGYILQNVVTGEYRYFVPYASDPFFRRPLYISQRRHLLRLRRRMEDRDITDFLLKQRDSTSWKPVLLCNVVFSITSTNFTLGAPITLPGYIQDRRCIIGMLKSKNSRHVYDDNLCLLRNLVYHREKHRYSNHEDFEETVEKYYQTYAKSNEVPPDPQDFQGFGLDDIAKVEVCFQINIQIFDLAEDGVAACLYKSACRFKDTMWLNHHNGHLSYITKLEAYTSKFICRYCSRLFKKNNNWQRHLRVCCDRKKFTYPGGYHAYQKDIFTQLEEFEIFVNENDRFYPWFCVFDFESILRRLDESDSPTEKLTWLEKHLPVSVSLCSNVENFKESFCIVEPDEDKLVNGMIEYMMEISTAVQEMAEEKWGWVIQELDAMIAEWTPKESTDNTKKRKAGINKNPKKMRIESDDESDCEVGSDEEEQEEESMEACMVKQLTAMKSKFETYMSQLPILGFNSGRYDMNLIRSKLAKAMELDESNHAYVVKRNNQYACMANENLKFLDLVNFLPPGTSYDAFLKAYDIKIGKSYFPYQYLDHPDKLKEDKLPPYEAFWSDLKDANVLEIEEIQYNRKLKAWQEKMQQAQNSGNEQEIIAMQENFTKLKLDIPPETGHQKYEKLQQLWIDENMQSFEDYLRHYNQMDTGPFVEAVEKMLEHYGKDGICPFKTALSVPGIARNILFTMAQKAGATFSLIGKENKDFYQMLDNNLTGGPSIIFTRKHKRDETYIRGGPYACKRILGYDANALYLWAFSQLFPVGGFIRRRSNNFFKPEKNDKYTLMYRWMDWVAKTEGNQILHKLNNNKEKRHGKYLADGWDAKNNRIYQFDGCWVHGHICKYNRNSDEKEMETRAKKTEERNKFYRSKGFDLVVKRECDFREEIKENPVLYQFVRDQDPPFFRKHRGSVNTDTILKAVRDGTLFGCVLADIAVPKTWSPEFQGKTEMSPYDYFSEMSPIFCTSEVPYEVIGKHMQEYAEKNGLSKKPRTLLVGGMAGKQMLLSTPLLKWYLDHGMECTNITEVIEYNSMACFRDFVKTVSDRRREGDQHKDKAVLADNAKLLGNSAFGSCILRKQRFGSIKYVSGQIGACMLANAPEFQKMTELDSKDEFFEVQMDKANIKLDVPLQIGFFILQYAKLRMLSFYYDMVDKYIPRELYQYCEMDTDSAYFCIHGESLLDVIKPEMKDKYLHGLNGFCNDQEVEADTEYHWFPRTCCTKHAKYDKRTPGLFKLEYSGDEIIGLCSKTYMVKSGDDYKFSSKGINRDRIEDPIGTFREVLETQTTKAGVNKGFRAKDNTMFTYSQVRNGFSYYYVKREVMENKVDTKPLDLVLTPRDKHQMDKYEKEDQMDNVEEADMIDENQADVLIEL